MDEDDLGNGVKGCNFDPTQLNPSLGCKNVQGRVGVGVGSEGGVGRAKFHNEGCKHHLATNSSNESKDVVLKAHGMISRLWV